MTNQYKAVDEIPFIVPDVIEGQYEVFSRLPDATPRLTAIRLARWAEATARTSVRVRENHIAEVEKAMTVIASYRVEAKSDA